MNVRISLHALFGGLLILAGCATTGTKLDPDAVYRIEKGRTTKSQVETMLGSPMSMSLLPDGRRQAMYLYHSSHGDALLYTPFVNYVAGGMVNHRQTLQVIYKDDVVQDFEFADTTEHTQGGMLNQHGRAVPTTNPG
jgi:outer membrane protein assembly factor BamE (lipoprotein component of BamABCDE complex)